MEALENKIKEDNSRYWSFQASGWIFFYIVFTSYGMVVYGTDWKIAVNYMFVTIIGLGLSHFYRLYVKKKEWHKQNIATLTFRILSGSVILGVFWLLLIFPVSFVLSSDGEQLTIRTVPALIFNFSFIFFVWNLIYFFYKLFTSYKESEIEKWRLMAAVKDAQLIALKSQINPHFIFNSLNNIRSLVVENPEKAREMITHLSSLLRYSIRFNNTEKVALKNEMDVVKYYLNLESIQFEDRLHFRLNTDDRALEQEIPPMAIQMLVENAIKHGISKLPDGGEIDVDCRVVDDELIVEVTNTGQIELENATDSGIGLKNATERLNLLFGKLSALTLENVNSNQVRAKFTVPTK